MSTPKSALLTIITRNYLPFAEAIFTSLRSLHPEKDFWCLIVDADTKRDAALLQDLPFPTIVPAELAMNSFDDMTIYYSASELCNAMKPFGISHLLKQKSYQRVVYVDSDMLMVSRLDSAFEVLERTDFTAAPHTLASAPDDGQQPDDRTLMRFGYLNGGLIGFRNSSLGQSILDWFCNRALTLAFADPANGTYYDQMLLNLASQMHPKSFERLDDVGCNVAYWNLHERTVTRHGQNFFVNGVVPLVYVHFSLFQPATPEVLTVGQSRHRLIPPGSALADLAKTYAASLAAAKPRGPLPYAFASHDGRKLDDFDRRYYFVHRRLLDRSPGARAGRWLRRKLLGKSA